MRTALIAVPAVTISMVANACDRGTGEVARSESAAGTVARSAPASRDSVHRALAAVPAEVTEVGEHAEDLYDAVAGGRWSTAQRILDSLRMSTGNLPASVDANDKTTLAALEDSLAKRIAGKQRLPAMIEANQATYISVQMLRPFASATPVQVLLLDYLGRELEIWSGASNAVKLASTKSELRKTWDEVRPLIAAHDAKQAAHTDALVARIERASTPQAIRTLATPFLDEVDRLEKVFTNQ